ncbi:hypothetical protein OUZ56_005711 [Daphnia magna]|uniref:DUF4806 domain-containing protein n=1 Tax=Daphnia magna TaxID=35525 RepID=A0ABQ9YTJ5_9CRUS|nr:hypothetical protein OUZ56_005711 [Daphnia magna]
MWPYGVAQIYNPVLIVFGLEKTFLAREVPCKVLSSHDTFQQAVNRKDECDTSDSAGIQRQRKQQVKPPLPSSNIVSNERVGDEIDTIDTGVGIGHVPKPITPTTASRKQSSLQTTVHEDSDSGMEESNISQIINAGPVTQPPTNTYLYCSTSEPSKTLSLGGTRALQQPGTSDAGEISRGQNGENFGMIQSQALMTRPSTSQETTHLNLKRKTPLMDQNRYLRVMARELSDIRAEQRDLRRLIIAKKQSVGSVEQNIEGNLHPVFQRHASLPLNTKQDFQHFEEELLQPEVKNNLVEMLRSFFEKTVDDTIRRIWREVMTNELMKTFTWSGTPKPNSRKEKGLVVKGSRLLSAVIDAVKFGDLSKTPIPSRKAQQCFDLDVQCQIRE